jgi:Tol biopolymer transport system component/imidazolonepropionase-like amidohydrolase
LKKHVFLAILWSLFLMMMGARFNRAAVRMIEFDTRQVTQPDVAVTPDGKTLIFTMLGHLFRLPVEGGNAEQLTFGPFYDTDPAISPDGTRVAFVSDRDRSEGNIFVLDLGTKQVTPLTKESRAGRPAWSPDGRAIVYKRFEPHNPGSTRAVVCRIPLTGGEPEIISSPLRFFGSLFFLPDVRLAWSFSELDGKTSRWTTRIEAVDQQGVASAIASFEGSADRVLPSPSGDGFYFRRRGASQMGVLGVQPDEIVFLSISDGKERMILPANGTSGTTRPRFAVAPDGQSLYFGQAGRLWRVLLPAGARLPIPLQTHVKLEVESITPPPTAILSRSSAAPRWIMTPRLTPDGKTLIFGAAGFLWRQPLQGGKAERISSGDVYEDGPSISPDGGRLAYIRLQGTLSALVVLDLKTGQIRPMASGGYYSEPGWSSDGGKLVFGEFGSPGNQISCISLADGKKEQLAQATPARMGIWSPRPHLSVDGRWLYYTADTSGKGELYRLSLKEKGKAERLTRLSRHVSDGQVSPDGKWLAFRRNKEIWVAPLGGVPITDDQVRQLSGEGGDSFVFINDSSALIFSAGNHVWRQPVTGGERREIPVRLELPHPTPRPLLLRGVRVLDYASGGFGLPATMLIEQGRISWAGSESGHQIPPDAEVVDGAGRFAIPGLFDFHVHAGGANQASLIAYGVTSARDVGGSITGFNALKDRSESGAGPIPRYFFSGEIFEGENPTWGDGFLQIYDEPSAREYVRRFKEWGADFIKIYPALPWPLQHAVVEEARRLGLPVAAHAFAAEGITKSVTWGCFTLEHGDSEQEFDDILQMLSLSGTHWVPTLAVEGADALLLRDEPERLSDAKFRSFTPEGNIQEALFGSYMRSVDDITLRGSVMSLLARVGEAHRRSVKLNAGTDPSNPECFFGPSLHWELARFVQAGLTPLEVLRMATEEAAAAVGATDLGTVAPGKIADIVILSADPLEDIHNTEAIWRVIKGGRLFDPDKLMVPAPSAEVSK